MKKLLLLAAAAGATSYAVAQGEPVLDWSVQRIDANGAALMQPTRQSNFDGTQLSMRVLCDPERATLMKWPEAHGVRVTVRPHMAKDNDTRMRVAEISCEEVRSNKAALESRIPRPKAKPTPEKKLIQLWD